MEMFDVAAWGTLMDPAVFKKYTAASQGYDTRLIYVDNQVRYFGHVQIGVKSIQELINEDDTLKSLNVAHLTVDPDSRRSDRRRYSAVLYENVPANVLSILSRRERKVNLEKFRVYRREITDFEEENKPIERTNRVWTFRAPHWLSVYKSEFRRVQIKVVRNDVLPDPEYLKRIKKAAGFHGQNFADAFLKTTYYADLRTPLTEPAPHSILYQS
jgi:hypothetical protein